jgi:chloride channel 3/4/5
MVTKAVSDQFGGGGIADQMIRFNGYPLLENHDHAFGVSGAPHGFLSALSFETKS